MKKGTAIILLGLLLIAAALSITGYNIIDDYRAGNEADEVLSALSPMIDPDPIPGSGMPTDSYGSPENIEYPDYVLNSGMDMLTKTVKGREYIGILSLPSINKEFPVLSEWDYRGLKIAPCRYYGSPYSSGFVICAHNYYRHFGPIDNLSYGDRVYFTDISGNVFSYEVTEITNLLPTSIGEMISDEWDLTLFTCTLDGRKRITVRCKKLSPTA